jgi:hypothetical protein
VVVEEGIGMAVEVVQVVLYPAQLHLVVIIHILLLLAQVGLVQQVVVLELTVAIQRLQD